MKKLLTMICAGVLVCALGVACDKPVLEPAWDENDWIDVSFADYSFEDGSSGEEISIDWISLDDVGDNKTKVLVINSDKKLKNYVSGDYPAIDFSKKTLVLAYGYNSGLAFGYDGLKFQQVSDRNYAMTVSGLSTAATVMIHWQVAIVVDKLPSYSTIKLNTVIKNLP